MNDEEIIAHALQDPAAALRALDMAACERSLLEFVKQAWHTLHPAIEFKSGWAVETMCRHLEAVTAGHIQKLLINVPPGCTKSMIVNVFWPLWEWGPKGRPSEKYISASYNLDLSARDLGHMREVMRSEWFQERWPMRNRKDHDGKEHYVNTNTGWRKATSVGGGLTGFRGSRFILDDPHSTKTAESDIERATARSWMSETVPTRFEDQMNPVYVVIMQRLNETDISGMIINKLVEEQGWVHLCLPMEFEPDFRCWTKVPNDATPAKMRRVKEDVEPIPYYVPDPDGELMWPQDPRTEENELLWPARFDRKSVDELKASFRAEGGTYAEACQLQQRPVPRGGGMFNREDLIYVDRPPTDGIWCRGWDLAGTKDGKAAWTVGLKMCVHKGRIYITDVRRLRGSPGEVMDAIKDCAVQDGFDCQQDLPQDPGQAGKAQKAYIARELHGYDFTFSAESGTKEDRARPLAAQAEAGNLFIVRAPWNDTFVAELALFPGSTYKDQIDAASRAYMNLIRDQGGGTAWIAPKLIS